MDIDTLSILSVYIVCNVRTLINYKNRFAVGFGFMCKYRSIEAGTYYQIIILHTILF